MGYKKKKNVIIITLCVVACFILYQLYFFLTITSETNNVNVILNHEEIKDLFHMKSEDDKYISDNGLLRGVHFSFVQQYRPDVKDQFKCRNSAQRIPFEQVNDDYCDCEDGSDEPSTNACADGIFYCEIPNQKKIIAQHTIPSSQVNDGICDCCDGSDEWLHLSEQRLVSQTDSKHRKYYVTKCPNVCSKEN